MTAPVATAPAWGTGDRRWVSAGWRALSNPLAASPAALDRLQRGYFEAFLLASALCWSPSKALGYAAPFAGVAWLFLRTWDRRIVERVGLFALVWAGLISFHAVFTRNFIVSSGLLAMATAGAAFFLVAVPTRALSSPLLMARMQRVTLWIVALQVPFAFVQALHGRSHSLGAWGDYVEGTIHPPLAADFNMGNSIFAANMTFSLLAILPLLMRGGSRPLIIFLLGALAVVMAAVVHMLLFVVIALLGAWCLSVSAPGSGRATRRPLVMALLVFPLFAYAMVPSFRAIPFLLSSTLDSPRRTAVEQAVFEIPSDQPSVGWVGFGPGQFSSRAGLMRTGLFLARSDPDEPIPFLPATIAPALDRYNTIDLSKAARAGSASSSGLPYFSWLTVATEYGFPALVLVIALASTVLYRLSRLGLDRRSNGHRALALAASASLLFLVLLGSHQNYWELPHAILIGCFFLKASYAIIVYGGDGHPRRLGSQAIRRRVAFAAPPPLSS